MVKVLISSQKLVGDLIGYVSKVASDITVVTSTAVPEGIADLPNIDVLNLPQEHSRKAIAERKDIAGIVEKSYNVCISRLSDPVGSAIPSAVLAGGGVCEKVVASIDLNNPSGARHWLPALRELSYYVASGDTNLYIMSNEFIKIGKLVAVVSVYTNMHEPVSSGPPYLTYRVMRGKLIGRLLSILRKARELEESGAQMPRNVSECLKKIERFVSNGTGLSEPIKSEEEIGSFIRDKLTKPLTPLFPLAKKESSTPLVFVPESMTDNLGLEVAGARVVPLNDVLEDEVLIVKTSLTEPLEHTFLKGSSYDTIKSAEKKYEIVYIETPAMIVKPSRSPALGYRPEHLHDIVRIVNKAVKAFEVFIEAVASRDASSDEMIEVATTVVEAIADLANIDQRYIKEKIGLIRKWFGPGETDLVNWASITLKRTRVLEEAISREVVTQKITELRNILLRSQDRDIRARAFRLSSNNLRWAISAIKSIAFSISSA